MEKLTQLISSLDKSEIKMVRRFYLLNKKSDSLIRNKLFDIIVEEPNIKPSKIAELLKARTSEASFSILKKRLIEDILKILLIAQGPHKFASKNHEARYRCGLMLVEIDVLRNKGGNEALIIDRIYQAERLANKYELTNEKILINDHKKDYIGPRKGLSVYSKTSLNDIENFKVVREKLDAQDFFRKLTMPNLFQTNKEINFIEQAKVATDELRLLSERNSSAHIKFYYLRSEIYYNHLINNYEKAEHFAYKFKDFVLNNRVVHSSDNTGGAIMMISTISVYLGNYDNAIKYAIEAMPYFHNASNNQINLSELLFFGYLRKENFSETSELVDRITLIKTVKKNQFLKSKWQYYKANLLFQQGHYNEALSILQKQSELLSDKSGWRLGYKIMEMMCIIELDTCDWLDYRIETFRKLLSTVKNENIHRPKLILHIIKQFIKNAYDIKATSKKCEEQLNLLRKGEEEYRYDARGYEIIRFDKWWDAKLNKKMQRN